MVQIVTDSLSVEALGARLRQARDASGLSREALAAKVTAGATSIKNYESGKNMPPALHIAEVARELGVDLRWLLAGRQDVDPDMQPSPVEGDPPRTVTKRAAPPAPYGDTFDLTVYTHVHASAGPPSLYGWEPTDEDDAVTVEESRRLFYELMGFWPDERMRGIRVKGRSGRRSYGGIEDGQIVLYYPVEGPGDIEDGKRYVLTVSEGDLSRVLVKRVMLVIGGGLRIFADNPEVGVPDTLLVPPPPDSEHEGLINAETGQPAHLQFLGRVVWPNEYDDASVIRTVARTLDQLIVRGYLPAAPAA